MKRLIASTMLVLASVPAWAAGTLQPLRAADVATLYA
ncbi:TlpA family protein disulfide reductase, partial [Burkholderia multivorans]|nr:TlpA family protein disulfide reductase [Burkholderia multivorans]